MAGTFSHDQNFKNLILDYPRQALAFFAPEEAESLDEGVTITPIRQEQLKSRLGDRFHELDVPLLVEWPDGRREALLFLLEEESDPARFSIHRLIVYCASLAEMLGTEHVVPVVIFLRGSDRIRRNLNLGSERHSYLSFNYLACVLPDVPVEHYLDSDNLVARLNLPNMRWPRERKVEIYAQTIRGLLTLEPNLERRIKYVDFVDTYIQLDDNEQRLYAESYVEENQIMTTWSERLRNEGLEQGMQQGVQQGIREGRQEGELNVLIRQLTRRFGPLDATTTERLKKASTDELERWADNILDARTLDEVFF
ncbi:MAG: DUF4351 domain-containing protein [Porticoccaceae bacterium]